MNATILDQLTAKHTAFNTFAQFCEAMKTYTPTLQPYGGGGSNRVKQNATRTKRYNRLNAELNTLKAAVSAAGFTYFNGRQLVKPAGK